jgi:tetratricopeptide (TPR) repeat protein
MRNFGVTRRGLLATGAIASLGIRFSIREALSGDHVNLRSRVDDVVMILDTAMRHVSLGMPMHALGIVNRLQESEFIFEIQSRPELYGRFLLVRASAHKQAGDVQLALGAYDQLQTLGQSEYDGERYGAAVVGKLVVLTQHNLADLGRRLFSVHLGSLREISNPALQIEVSARAARILEELGDLESAREIVEKEILPSSPHVDEPGAQLDREMLACRLYVSGTDRRWTLAEKALGRAQQLASKDDNLWRRGQFEAIYGIFNYHAGNIEESQRANESAKSLLSLAGSQSHHAKMLDRMLASSS